MNVLQLIDTLEAGGAERMAVNLANAGTQHTYRSFLCATRAGGPLATGLNNDIPLLITYKKRISDIRALRALVGFVKKHQIDIIHAHSTSIYTAFLVKMILPSVKLVWHDHYGWSEALDKRSTKGLGLIARFMAGAVACNKKLRDWASKRLGVKKSLYLPNFSVPQTTGLQTEIFGIKGKRIVCLANLRPQKNHLELLEVFASFYKNHPEYSLHLVGKDFKDDYAQKIMTSIKALGLEKAVFCYGSRPDSTAILEMMDIAVLLSTSEGLPLALLEYGMAGLPTIVTDVGMCSEVVADTAFVVQNVQREALGYLEQYHQQPELKKKMGMAFRHRIQKEFDAGKSAQELFTFYQSLT